GEATVMVDTAPTRKRTRKAGREKPEILEAAVRVIIERGVERTRFADVSDATGVPIASLQYYFGSREDLLIAAFRHGSEACVAEVKAGLEAVPDPRDRILYVIDAHLDTYDPDASDQALLLSEEFYRLARRDPALRLDLLDEYNAWRSMISEAISLGVAGGQFSADMDPERDSIRLYAFMEGIAGPVAMGDPALPRETARQLVCEYMDTIVKPRSGRTRSARGRARATA
ncbi:MAG: TetR/AcrR family transcriptional regulator, partial [Acidimicrobiales bacterium]